MFPIAPRRFVFENTILKTPHHNYDTCPLAKCDLCDKNYKRYKFKSKNNCCDLFCFDLIDLLSKI